MMRTAAEAGLNGRSLLPYPRGKVLGGCSSINGMIYMRGQAADYDGWRQAGNKVGDGMTCFPISSNPRITTAAILPCTRQAANGARRQRLFLADPGCLSATQPRNLVFPRPG